ncbi:helix-turn-helix domain-containing protein [Methylophilus flavus]|uniref:Helix-turn-helix domain-containing protein n=1 Tax=Methylophilus flavus TaxID=640084 RepID=A0ABW3PAN9_9PROT
MSPGALFLKTARSSRNLYQKEIAHLLGLNASTIACIESGHKNVDWKKLELVMIEKLQLNESERLQLADAVSHSDHKFRLSLKTPHDKFYIVNEIFNQLDTMSQKQVDLIKLCLRLEDIHLLEHVLKLGGYPY